MISVQIGRLAILCEDDAQSRAVVRDIFPTSVLGAVEYGPASLFGRQSVQIATVWADGPDGALVKTECARIVWALGPDALSGGPNTIEEMAACLPCSVAATAMHISEWAMTREVVP
jgi:hypothetical protein